MHAATIGPASRLRGGGRWAPGHRARGSARRHARGVVLALAALAALGCAAEDRHARSVDGGPPVPLVLAFQPQENPEGLAPDARRLAAYLAEALGTPTEVYLPTTYAAVVEALRAGHAHVGYLSGWPYLIAHREAGAELLVAEERQGATFYYSQWYVRSDGDIETLEDLRGRHVAFTSPTSTSGYLFPLARVIEAGLLRTGGDPKAFFGEVLFAGGYQQALQALAHGSVDAAAASDYAFDLYLDEAQRARVRVLERQGPIPTHGIAVRGSLPDAWKVRIREALLSLNEEPHRDLLRSVYGAERLVARSHEEHVSALERALVLVGSDERSRRASR
jgi:phosphonate transport system substrate-binding protein